MNRLQSLDVTVDFDRLGQFSFDRKRPAAPQVYADLRDRIITLEIAPGASLSRPALASHYRLSQTPIRDAILKLEQDGLVEIYPQSRTLVARIDIEDARETQFLRSAIELEIARALALRPDKKLLDPARDLLARQRQVRETDDSLTDFVRLDRLFHQSLYDAAGHRRLWDLVVQRSGHLDRLRRLHLPTPGKMDQILSDHHAIIEAISRSDLPATDAAVRSHLSGTLAAADAIVEAHPDCF